MNIKLTANKAEVIIDNRIIKTQELNKEEFKELMVDLCGEDIDLIRKASKLLKAESFTFVGVHK